MKKKLNSSSKRKWIINGALAFGAVALLTTGFATWIIGVQNANDDVSTSVTVETATNESVELKASLSDAIIKLAETDVVESGVVKEENPSGDLEITFGTITLTYGGEWLKENEEIKGLTIAFATEEDGIETGIGQNENNNLTDAADLINKRSGESYTYIDLSSNLTGFNKEAAKETTDGNMTVLTWTNVKYTFEWGSFFKYGETKYSPAKFYNKVFETGATSEDANNIQSELNAMKEAFMTGESHDKAGQIVLYMGVEKGAIGA